MKNCHLPRRPDGELSSEFSFDDEMLRHDLGYPLVASLRRSVALEKIAQLHDLSSEVRT